MFLLHAKFKYRFALVALGLPLLGLVLIISAQAFHFTWMKVEVDRLLAEIGSLLVVVSLLHWLFELGLREEMLRDVAETATSSSLLHENGLETCNIDSRQVDHRAHWEQPGNLTIGRQYSTALFKNYHELFKQRCARGFKTTVIVLGAEGHASILDQSGVERRTIQTSLRETIDLLKELDSGAEKHIKIRYHHAVLRYSFIHTNEYIWITFYTNSSGRATVPAFKVRANTPLFEFFSRDITRLSEQSHAAN